MGNDVAMCGGDIDKRPARRNRLRLGRILRGATAGLAVMSGMLLGSTAFASVLDRPFFRAQSIVIVIGASDFSNSDGAAPVAADFLLLDQGVSGSAAPDIIGLDGVTTNFNTGQFNASEDGSASGYEFEILDPVSGGAFNSTGPHQTLDANDSYTAFTIDNDTSIGLNLGNRASRFLVASNAPFDIYAQASDLVATGGFSALDYSNIGYRLRVQVQGGSGVWRWGERAQNPGNGGGGIINSINDLSDMEGVDTKVFDGGQRTAASRGTLLEQAVSFQSRYNLRRAGSLGLNNYDLSMGAGELGATVTYTVYTP